MQPAAMANSIPQPAGLTMHQGIDLGHEVAAARVLDLHTEANDSQTAVSGFHTCTQVLLSVERLFPSQFPVS
jgi:hypothetical protein